MRLDGKFIVSAIVLSSAVFFSGTERLQAGSSGALVPHQAIYTLRLATDSPVSQFSGLDGAAVSLIERTCEGWVVTEEVVMTMLTNVGGAIEREMQFKARESADGQDYVFDSRSVTNGNVEVYSGTANRAESGAADAEFITPRPFEMALPNGTRFYVGLSKWLLNLAESGVKTGETFAFDGTDDEGPQKVTAFILPDQGPHDNISGDKSLLSAKAWRVRMAFFKTEGQAAQPEFEISLRLLSNGIVTSFRMVFDDLIVNQELEDVLPARDERCG